MHHVWVPYCGAAPVPDELLGRWNFDPPLLIALAAAPLLYLRFMPGRSRVARAGFAVAWTLSIVLFVSPFCALTSALFSARIVHHLLLTIALAPLLALAAPKARVSGSLAAWTGLQAIVFWGWHAPAAYSAALSSIPVYWLMQSSLIASAAGFWIAVRRASAPGAVAALLATMVQMGLLGALITFAGTALYAPHFASTQSWGLSALEDQQLAGLIMWVPGAGFYLGAAVLVASRWLARAGLETSRLASGAQ
ncbi:MAG TPA: cytochrome c oxidase assembly protein [Sphingomicrobium sp.]|nr:cytochrome c oxidase assembly protein [Sphingomicrobium sp.]